MTLDSARTGALHSKSLRARPGASLQLAYVPMLDRFQLRQLDLRWRLELRVSSLMLLYSPYSPAMVPLPLSFRRTASDGMACFPSTLAGFALSPGLFAP